MTIEIMNASHLHEIELLQCEWANENITYGVAAGTVEQIAEGLSQFCYVAKDKEKIIAYLMADIRHGNEYCVFPTGVSFVEVYDLFVTKDYRSRGIGKKLLLHCEQEAFNAEIKHMLLSSATKDSKAVRNFYTNNEYTIWTTQFFKHLG